MEAKKQVGSVIHKLSSGAATVTQSNHLIEASYRLTLEEKRLVIAAIATIDSRGNVPDQITLTAEDYAKAFDLQMKSAYQQLKAVSSRFFEREIRVQEKGDEGRMRWVSKILYHERKGSVSLWFTPQIQPYIGQLQEQFTHYRLRYVKSLKSIYSIRLYELICQYHPEQNKRFITVESLRNMLDLGDKYPRYADLKRWVIEPALKEINQATNFNVDYYTEKKGRAVEKIWLTFKEKEQLDLAL